MDRIHRARRGHRRRRPRGGGRGVRRRRGRHGARRRDDPHARAHPRPACAPSASLLLGRAGMAGVTRRGRPRHDRRRRRRVAELADGGRAARHRRARAWPTPRSARRRRSAATSARLPASRARAATCRPRCIALDAQVRSRRRRRRAHRAGRGRSSPRAPRAASCSTVAVDEPRGGGVPRRVSRPHAHAYTILAVAPRRDGGRHPRRRRRRRPARRPRCASVEQALAGGADAAEAAAAALDDVEPADDALASAWYRAPDAAGPRRARPDRARLEEHDETDGQRGGARACSARRSPRSCTCCARSSASRARRPAASRAAAAPAPCSSTASRAARACCRSRPSTAREITTVEGLGDPEDLSTVQAAFHEHYAAQCGFCTLGLRHGRARPRRARRRRAVARGDHRGARRPRLPLHGLREDHRRGRGRGARRRLDARTVPAAPDRGEPARRRSRGARHEGRRRPPPALRRHRATSRARRSTSTTCACPGTLWAKALRSPHHQRAIRSLDTSRAEAMPGVHAVVTHRGRPAQRLRPPRGARRPADEPLLAEDEVRYKGQPIAAVAADDRGGRAGRGRRDRRRVRGARAVPRHPHGARSRTRRQSTTWGPVYPPLRAAQPPPRPQGRRRRGRSTQADDIVEGVYRPQAIEHVPDGDRRSALVVPEPNGRLTIYSCTQAMYFSMGVVAAHLQWPLNKLKFVGGTVGGGFGGKVDTATETICALLAIKSQRPVKWRFTREEEFLDSSTRAPWHVEIARRGDERRLDPRPADADAARRRRATRASRPTGSTKHAFHHTGAYTIPNLRFDGFVVFTNRVPTTAMRGFGVTSVSLAIEMHLSRVAEGARDGPVRAAAQEREPHRGHDRQPGRHARPVDGAGDARGGRGGGDRARGATSAR